MLFFETYDLVWEIISVSEKRTKNYYSIVKIIDNVFEKNDEGGLFPLKIAPVASAVFTVNPYFGSKLAEHRPVARPKSESVQNISNEVHKAWQQLDGEVLYLKGNIPLL